MIKTEEKSCSGCRACEHICPVNCITFTENRNGFLIPDIDMQKCVNCGMCEKVCPVNGQTERHRVRSVYAAYSNQTKAVNSTSGGIFYSLAYDVISKGGIVFGAGYDSDMSLQIKEAITEEELVVLQGSKYFQADTMDTYESVRSYLKQGKNVLYSGTPCQIAGLHNLLKNINTDRLVTVEIICHGTPSPGMFRDYLEWMMGKKGKKISDIHFRTKKKKDRDFYNLIKYEDGSEEIVSGFRDSFYKKFMSGDCYREICYECPFAKESRVADITLGDFWNIEDIDIHFGGKDRVSAVLINSEKGKSAWEGIAHDIIVKEVDWNTVVKGNKNLRCPSQRPETYMAYGDVENTNEFFDEVLKAKGNRKKELFNMLPAMLRKRIKKFF